ncbi:TerB family tellurite resistance protein [Helicobacter bizzozeronii]|uniref:TerB family tellurite resistance protein n=1 Tax=Helicobacter bizzozeronii TaxID=56877 RepID=UPI000CF0775E|nr:TerB family tellurite resistance protein [Helicobacter bizzozeronii]
MEVILIVGVAVVLIYLYYTLQEYLKNPLKSFPTPSPEPVEKVPEIYTLPDPLEVLKSSEQGVVVGLIAQFGRKLNANALSDALLEIFLKDLSQMGTETRNLEELKKLYASEDLPSLESLCTQFLELAHGEYKKRVKLVEFLLVLVYSDGILGEAEREALIDVGAFLRLENADFNQLYEGFERLSLQSMELSPERASEILGTSGNPKSSFEDKVNQNHLNILDPKTWNKSYIPDRMQTLWELQQAYNTLQNAPTKVSLTKNH